MAYEMLGYASRYAATELISKPPLTTVTDLIPGICFRDILKTISSQNYLQVI
jgi:hypothetical protein